MTDAQKLAEAIEALRYVIAQTDDADDDPDWLATLMNCRECAQSTLNKLREAHR